MSKVKFDSHGFAHIRVSISERNKTLSSIFSFKVDTGASCNTIGREHLYDLGYDDDWIKSGQELVGDYRPTMASGKAVDVCYKVILPEIRFGVFTGRNVRFITGLKYSFKLLLGTSTLRYFKWELDYENGLCTYMKSSKSPSDSFNSDEPCFYSIDELKEL